MAETKTHHIVTDRTARYYTLGEVGENTSDIWLVLHGYGQLASYFIKHFELIQNEHNCIIAPEALSRYYLNENTGRIGATWMTKEDRENEIKDYLKYLDNILDQFPIPDNCRIHVLGFSQGAATASRWLFHTKFKIQTLICWAGFFPPDMQWESEKYLDPALAVYLIYGNNDEYLTLELKQQMEQVLSKLSKKPTIINFEGRHQVVPATLRTLQQTIEK